MAESSSQWEKFVKERILTKLFRSCNTRNATYNQFKVKTSQTSLNNFIRFEF